MLGLENMSNRMMRIGRQELYFNRYYTLDDIIRFVEEVTVEEVQAIAEELFDTDRFTSVVLLPSET